MKTKCQIVNKNGDKLSDQLSLNSFNKKQEEAMQKNDNDSQEQNVSKEIKGKL